MPHVWLQCSNTWYVILIFHFLFEASNRKFYLYKIALYQGVYSLEKPGFLFYLEKYLDKHISSTHSSLSILAIKEDKNIMQVKNIILQKLFSFFSFFKLNIRNFGDSIFPSHEWKVLEKIHNKKNLFKKLSLNILRGFFFL